LEYAKEGDIAKDDDEYTVGDIGDDKPLAKGNDDNNNEYAKDGDRRQQGRVHRWQ
jgi:hypothetical protein